MKKIIIAVLLAIVLSIVIGYYIFYVSHSGVRIKVTTTTSLYATGLLEYLTDNFKKTHSGVEIDFIPVGSGEALRRAADGEACMVFVHAPSLEKEYIKKGVLVNGHIFAYNYFVLAGPSNDPAGVRNAHSILEVFQRIYDAGEKGLAKFVSRGDNSGTHVKELSIWSKVGLKPQGRPWYLETGSGMAQTLIVANEERAYVLTDIGTYLKFKIEGKIPNLEILYENDTELLNIYSVYLVSMCSGSEREAALEFLEFVITEGQNLINSYGIDEYGQRLFNPAINDIEWLKKMWEILSTG